MKILISLLYLTLAVRSSCGDGISIIGPRYIRPNRPYTVAFANPLNKGVKLKLSLQCDSDLDGVLLKKQSSLQLSRHSGKTFSFPVPSINQNSDCSFSVTNDGGDVMINYDASLLIPKKTVSIFIQTDKPVYKPGDVLRFRVVVVDIETKPVTHLKSIEVLIRDSNDNTARHWTFGKLRKGIFETSYQMAAAPVLGTWTISVTVNDNSILNEKVQYFEVMEYVLPKFAVKVWPTKTLLIEDRKISLNVDSQYTFGQRVEGKVQVNLYLDNYSQMPNYKATKEIIGQTVVEFLLDDELDVDDQLAYALVNMTATVTDSFSNETVTITQNIPVYAKPYRMSLITTSSRYHPGAPYHFKVSVRDHTGVAPEEGKPIKIFVDGEEQSANLDDQGLASFVITAPEGTEPIPITAELDSVEYDNVGSIQGLESSSSQYLQIQSKQRIIVGKTASFTIKSNEHINQLSYFIVTRGSIVICDHMKVGQRKTFVLKLKLTEAMAPKATLMVFTSKNGAFISDSVELNFESFGNDFEFRLDEESYRPNEEISIQGKAQKDSVIVFQAIDRSALLLGHTEYGITKQGILDDLDLYEGDDRDNSLNWFDSKGLFYRGDTTFDNHAISRAKRSFFHKSSGQKKVRNAVLLRTDFPEAWLWRNSSMNNRYTFEIEDLVPDTITSWHVMGFALSPTRGLGIMNNPRMFTVGKTFYMIAHLPYSIKRGEVALIQVTLYNFLGNTVTTDVTLSNKNDEIEFVENSSKDNTRRTKAIALPSHQVKPMSFLIKAKKLGDIAIKIEAVSDLASDGLEHLLRVTPESRLYKKNEARFVELSGLKNQSFNIKCDIPRDADPGSTKIMATIDHDFLGLPSKHAESLINIPKGSCDLNLLTLIPNMVALDYLESMGSNAKETTKQKAIDFLNKGYDNQLKYRSSNGAFRQWISDKGKESIFLTALVANAFVTASKYITVNHTLIRDAFSWLEGKQKNTNGCFDEVGEVLYSPIQSSPVALTAFVVAAIRENPVFHDEYGSLVDKAVKCLANSFGGLNKDYEIALATYALSLTNHTKREDYLNKLVTNSIQDEKERYWNEGSLSIEIAGYALLSYLAQGLPLQALEIYEWLNRQRYASGEFAGIQSTFVGLKAVGKMAQILTQSPIDYRVRIKSSIDRKSLPKTWNFHIEQQEALHLTELELPDTHRIFNIDFAGIGYGLFQLSYQYHQNIGSAKESFELRTELLNTTTNAVQHLKVCLKYKKKEAYVSSNKAVVEVHLPSGLFVNNDAVRDLSPGKEIKNVMREFDGSAVYVYYNSVRYDTPVCFEVTAYRKFKIAMHRPAYVVVYDTEDRDRFALATYEGKVVQVCDICENEDCTALRC